MPRPLAVVLLSSLLLKLVLLAPARSNVPIFDAASYVGAAVGLLERGEYLSIRAPGYPAMLAAVFWVAKQIGLPLPKGGWVTQFNAVAELNAYDLVRLFQVLLSSATVFLLYLLARQFFDERAAIAAAAITAFYPSLVGYSHYLWSETLFIFLMVSGILMATIAARNRRVSTALACGLVLGLSALTREIGLVVIATVAIWVWIDIATDHAGLGFQLAAFRTLKNRGSATALATAVLMAAAATVLPWTLRNFRHHGELVLISASGGAGLLFGATDDPIAEIEGFADRSLRYRQLERDRRCGQRAREIIAADPVGWVKRCLTHNIPSLFQPIQDGVITYLLSPKKGYGVVPVWLIRAMIVLLIGTYATLTVTAVVGVWVAGERRFTLLFLGLVIAYVASHAIVLGVTRHRLPLEVMATIFAGVAISGSFNELRSQMTATRILGIIATLTVIGTLVLLSPTQTATLFWHQAATVAQD